MARGFDDNLWRNRLGRALRQLRQERGWTQRQVAEASGVGKPLLSGYERGHSEPKVLTLKRILDGLGIDFSDLERALSGAPTPSDRRSLPAPPPGEVAATFLVVRLEGGTEEEVWRLPAGSGGPDRVVRLPSSPPRRGSG